MKILFIADFSLQHNSGGAQVSNDILIRAGKDRDHEIHQMFSDSNLSTIDLIKFIGENKYDYIISSNLEVISRQAGLLDLLYMLPNHIRVERDMNLYLSEEARHKLFSNCVKTFFLTDYHYQQFRNFYGDYFQNVEILPSPFDTEKFIDKKTKRLPLTLYSGFCHSFKGTNVFIRYAKENPDRKFICSCWGDDYYINQIKSLSNVEFIGKTDYKDMPDLYNKVDTFFYQPNMHEPLCRSVTEAVLCGVPNMILNDKIGATHEIERVGLDSFRETCGNSAQLFWQILEDM